MLNAILVLASIDILFYIIYIINTMKKHYFILFYNFYVLYSFVFKMQKRSCFESAPTHPSTPYFTICNYALVLSKNPLTHLQICGFFMSRLIQISWMIWWMLDYAKAYGRSLTLQKHKLKSRSIHDQGNLGKLHFLKFCLSIFAPFSVRVFLTITNLARPNNISSPQFTGII